MPDPSTPSHKDRTVEGDVDLFLQRTLFRDVENGVVVDVGAARPDFLSISASFREVGWHAIAVEPNPEFCKLYHQRGLDVLPYACGDHDEDDVDFFVVDSPEAKYHGGTVTHEAFSSLGIKDEFRSLADDLSTKKIKVNMRRLDTILRTHAPDISHIDLLSIDVEGWELEVLKGFSIDAWKPTAIVMENLFNDVGYRQFMAERGYRLLTRLEYNDLYVPRQVYGELGPMTRLRARFAGLIKRAPRMRPQRRNAR